MESTLTNALGIRQDILDVKNTNLTIPYLTYQDPPRPFITIPRPPPIKRANIKSGSGDRHFFGLTRQSLKDWMQWGNKVEMIDQKLRDENKFISIRLKTFIEKISQEAAALHNDGIPRKDIEKTHARLVIDMDAAHSRFQNEKTLVKTLIEFARATDEIKISLQFGDNLAKSLSDMKQDGVLAGAALDEGMNWERVARCLDEEAKEVAKAIIFKKMEPPPTPFMDAVRTAAENSACIDATQLEWEIQQYAKRNRFAHNGWQQLYQRHSYTRMAQMSIADLSWVRRQYRNKPTETDDIESRKRLEELLLRQQRSVFVYVKQSGEDEGSVVYELTPREKKRFAKFCKKQK